MSRRYRLRQVDVFTDRPLAGNPLAVVLDAEGLSEAEMQSLAQEMNLSETAFVLPPTAKGRAAGADYRVRIFMPRRELPFAGHPVVGTAWVLADEGLLELAGETIEAHNELGVGVLPLTIGRDPDGRVGEVTMTQGQPRLLETLGPAETTELARALEVEPQALGWPARAGERAAVPPAELAPAREAGQAAAGIVGPPRVVSTGLPYLVVPFRELRAVAAVAAERGAAGAAIAGRHGCDSVALVAPGSSGAVAGAAAHVRVLCDPATGVVEDPATGSAAGPIAVYLGHLAGARGIERRLVLEQGVEMGRPSRLEVRVDFDTAGVAGGVLLSGRVAPVFEGWLTLP
ncbi:MAG TPA: PhzF family phenazine biosynthesis protein [Candidatus Limnocylindrales bacterium]|nr:PhzF family phenazine biosynthesis protein [Candidatus Limnocylindrales bacterium]